MIDNNLTQGQSSLKQPKQISSTVGSQTATVCLPISIIPYANTSSPIIRCCGVPVINYGAIPCKGKVNGTCDFTITQKITVDIPVEFGANVKIGETYSDCGGRPINPCDFECMRCRD